MEHQSAICAPLLLAEIVNGRRAFERQPVPEAFVQAALQGDASVAQGGWFKK